MLAAHRGLDDITISDIAEQAGVNRSTFYQHYSDKETLLADAFDLVAEQAGAMLDGVDPTAERAPDVVVTFLAHIEAHADLYVRVFTEPGYGAVLSRLREHIRAAIVTAVDRIDDVAVEVPVDVLAAGVAGTVVGVIGAWLSRDERASALEASQWVWAVLQGPRRL